MCEHFKAVITNRVRIISREEAWPLTRRRLCHLDEQRGFILIAQTRRISPGGSVQQVQQVQQVQEVHFLSAAVIGAELRLQQNKSSEPESAEGTRLLL